MGFIHIIKNIAKNKTALLILIVLLGVALRVIRALEMNRYDVDCYYYFDMAINWAKYGANYMYSTGADTIPPLLPFLMSIGYKLGVQPEITGTFLGILLGSMIPLCMFYTVNILFKRSDLALLAAFLGAIHPSLVRISVRCLRDSLYIPLVAIALVLAVAAIKKRSILKWCMFSVTVVLSSLTRYEGPELILIFLVWFCVEIIVNLINKFKPSTISHQPLTLVDIRYYCCSFFLVLVIFQSLSLYVSHSLGNPRYAERFSSILSSHKY